MAFAINLAYTPRCPKSGSPFTESGFVRRSTTYWFDINEIGVALVDLWNFGYDDGPLVPRLGTELSYERGVSHAVRKRTIIEDHIAPSVKSLRALGVQIFHCNHPTFLMKFPQWMSSTTEEERQALEKQEDRRQAKAPVDTGGFPPREWTERWKQQHVDDVFDDNWSKAQAEAYDQIRLPQSVVPTGGDLLVHSKEQFRRLLKATGIKVLFYMGFETDECVMNSTYGVWSMYHDGFMTNIVRDCTTTYESADTLPGLWRTRVAIETIEKLCGYSVGAEELVASVSSDPSLQRVDRRRV